MGFHKARLSHIHIYIYIHFTFVSIIDTFVYILYYIYICHLHYHPIESIQLKAKCRFTRNTPSNSSPVIGLVRRGPAVVAPQLGMSSLDDSCPVACGCNSYRNEVMEKLRDVFVAPSPFIFWVPFGWAKLRNIFFILKKLGPTNYGHSAREAFNM